MTEDKYINEGTLKVMHIITGLGSGGAEAMLYKLLQNTNTPGYYHEVVSLHGDGVYGSKIRELGIKVTSFNLTIRNLTSVTWKIRAIVKKFDIVDTWLYHADFIGFFIAKVFSNKKLIWNIRHSNLDQSANKKSTILIVKINKLLSKYVDMITFNSNRAIDTHRDFGFSLDKHVMIPNGFDLEKFNYRELSRDKLRKQYEVSEEISVLITVGRWNIQKDYVTLFKALRELKKFNRDYVMVMVGKNLDYNNEELLKLVREYDLEQEIILLGVKENIADLLSMADIYVSSSLGESFSNSIGEAMASKLFCVVTNAGDSASIVGSFGKVSDVGDFRGLSSNILSYLNETNFKKNDAARAHIINKYDIRTISSIFLDNYNYIYFERKNGDDI